MPNSSGNDGLSTRVAIGLRGVGASAELEAYATSQLCRWMTEGDFSEYVPQLTALISAERWPLLLDAFCRILPFGTGGRRGPVGIGPNRMNAWTLTTSVQGHVAYLRERFSASAPLRVVVAYDVRCFRDFGDQYVSGVSNPVLDLTSRELAERAACVYAANGVDVFMQSRDDVRFMSTPELSHAVRFHKAHGGLNISASHNPPDDNGAKFYNGHGGQFVPPNDSALTDFVNAVKAVQEMPWAAAVESRHIHWLSGNAYEAYVELVASQGGDCARNYPLAFTGLHGAGTWSVPSVLRRAGFQVFEEPEQAVPDGSFSTVPGRSANPEIPICMERVTRYADDLGCDFVLGTDPDADRIGASVKVDGEWRFLTGNEIAVLVTHRALSKHPSPSDAIVMRTEVTSQLVSLVARGFGAKVVDNLLVGFKYIGDGLRQLEDHGHFAGVDGVPDDFVVGVEESHGILTSSEIRDKDAAGGALLLAELAADANQRGLTVLDELEAIWARHGYVANRLVSTVMRGVTGRQCIESILASLRGNPPVSIGGIPVTNFVDHQDRSGPRGDYLSDTDRAARNVLVFELGKEGRVIVRPSGTEPKCKVYGEWVGKSASVAEERLVSLIESFLELMLARVDIAMPTWGHGASDQLAVESKVAFSTKVFPAVLKDAQAGSVWEPKRLAGALAEIDVSDVRWVQGAVARWAMSHAVPDGVWELFFPSQTP